MKGFLGTPAGFGADLNLLIQVAMGMVLIAGAFLARRKHYRAHGACQSAVLVLNLALIFSVMWPSFHLQVLPGLRRHFGKRYYAIATIHGVAGAVTDVDAVSWVGLITFQGARDFCLGVCRDGH